MNDEFDEIRAERESGYSRRRHNESPHAGLWKQIAIGVWVGLVAAGATGMLFWAAVANMVLSGLQFKG